jgi:hypothetical protein
LRDYAEYLAKAQTLYQALSGVLPICELRLRATGRGGSSIEGVIRTDSGFELEIRRERFVYDRTDRCEKADYCYDFKYNGRPLIRFETDRNPRYPPHAHVYRRDLPGSEEQHLPESRWPDRIKRPDFLKMYAFFQDVVRFGGELPPPFGEGGVEPGR